MLRWSETLHGGHSHGGHSHGGHSHGAHPHGGGPATGSAAARHQKRLAWALALTAGYMVAEVAGALITGSLALLADAAHMLTDAGGLALALIAIRFSRREPTALKSYGFMRGEILAALLNAVVLLLLTAYILWEAYQRFLNPPEILGWPMLAVACVGLVVNLASMKLLSAGAEESLNVKAAYFEVFSDMLGSLGVILAAAIIMLTGWTLADPIVGAAIGLFIVPRTWRLMNQAVHILLEGVPAHVDLDDLRQALVAIDGVKEVSDLHVWTITSGVDAMSCHLVVTDMNDARRVLRTTRSMLKERHNIDHITVQIEDEDLHAEKTPTPF
jgi:cobalt-zinc-cadmium efflux system protein